MDACKVFPELGKNKYLIKIIKNNNMFDYLALVI